MVLWEGEFSMKTRGSNNQHHQRFVTGNQKASQGMGQLIRALKDE